MLFEQLHAVVSLRTISPEVEPLASRSPDGTKNRWRDRSEFAACLPYSLATAIRHSKNYTIRADDVSNTAGLYSSDYRCLLPSPFG